MHRYTVGVEVTNSAQVLLNDLTDLDAITQSPIDFITAGYASGNEISNPSLGILYQELVNQETGAFATVLVDGVPKLANVIYYKVYSANSKEPYRSYNGPEVAGVYTARLFYTKPNGDNKCIDTWEESYK